MQLGNRKKSGRVPLNRGTGTGRAQGDSRSDDKSFENG